MFATLQRRKRFERALTLLITVSLCLSLTPSPTSATVVPSSQASQQQAAPVAPAVPQPAPAPAWPEAGAAAQYTAQTGDLPAPAAMPAPAVLPEQAMPAAEPAPELPPLVLPAGPVEVTLGAQVGTAQVADLPLMLEAAAESEPLTARVEMLDAQRAGELSALDFAFGLQVQGSAVAGASSAASENSTATASYPLTVTIDYSRLPLAQVGDVAGRLALYRASGCAQADAGLSCSSWELLPAHNDRAAQQLQVALPVAVQPSAALPEQPAVTTPTEAPAASAPAPTAAPTPAAQPAPAADGGARLFLPWLGAEATGNTAQQPTQAPGTTAAAQLYLPAILRNQPQMPASGNDGDVPPTLLVLATSTSGPDGDYTATPLSVVSDYQTDLFTGAFATGYDIALPPAAGGKAPKLHLAYNSGSVDTVGPDTNSQASQVGLGWELDTGSITRLLKSCASAWGSSDGGLCSAGDNYVLSLNGMTSRLIPAGGNRYRLQHDPLWVVEYYTSTVPTHPDLDKRYWQITTPDGTKYRFGGEYEPETGADQNSVFYVPLHTKTPPPNHPLPPSAWRWNLDRVEDSNGNVTSYFYDLELHYYYSSLSAAYHAYVRAGNLSRIEYTKRAGQSTQPQARVLFNTELRCADSTRPNFCDVWSAFPDAPADLDCLAPNACRQLTPAFWSERRLASIQTQVYDQTAGRWRTANYYDLRHEFPGTLNRKLWLSGIRQRAGGNYQWSAYTQLEAEKLDAAANVTVTEMTQSTLDWGMGSYVRSGGVNSYLVLRDVDFGSGAASVVFRYQQGVNGAVFELRLDSPTGTQVAGLTRSVYSYEFNKWLTTSSTVSGASGVHDLYVIFKQGKVALNWLLFVPASAIPSLPEATYGYVMLEQRVGVAGASQFSLPRLNQVTTELGGSVQVTYGQSHPCPSTGISTIRIPYDCFPEFAPSSKAPPNYGGETDFALWNKWKVLKLEKRDGLALNPSEAYTYTYSAPTWRYSDNPLLPNLTTTYCSLPPCNFRHWNEFRGHELVTVTDSSGAQTEYRFYRGLDGDRLGVLGGVYTATITLSDGSTRPDSNWLAGQIAEERRLKPDGSVVVRTVNWYTSTLTAGSGDGGAYFSAAQQVEVTTYGAGAGAAGVHTTRTGYAYDAYGNVTRQVLYGDIATPDDDRNLERSYVYNTTAYLVDKPQWQKLWPGLTSGAPGQEQSYTAYLYDGASSVGAVPTKGNQTGVQSYWQATPSYAYLTTTTTYDDWGRPLTVTDGRGNATTTSYHPFYGYAASVTNALGHVTSSVVDPRWGVPTQKTDANGRVTTLQYDGYGRLTAVWLPSEPTGGPASYLFSYDAAARPAWVQSRQLQDAASGAYQESWQYVDGFGRTLQTQQPAATTGSRIVTSQQYDGQGRLLHKSAAYSLGGTAGSGYVAPDWNTVASYHRYGYDELGNQAVDETRSQGSVLWAETTVRDGWQQRTYDANGRRTDYNSDAFGNLVAAVEYNAVDGGATASYTTTYGYNLSGALTQVTDAAGNVTGISYDLLGRKISMSDPDMGQWQYQYDAAGNLVAQQDGRGQWLYLGYDALNRPSWQRQDDPTTGNLLAEYSYDAPGQLGLASGSRAYSGAGVVEVQSVAYDSRNQVTQQQWVVPGAGGGVFRLDTSYNAAGQKATLTYPGGNSGQQGEVVSLSYNSLGQLTSVTGGEPGLPVQYLSAASYNAQGQPVELTNDTGANAITRQYVYESSTLRLSVLRSGRAAPYADLQELGYSYDNSGNVLSLSDGRNQGQRQCFRYDWLDRLTGAFTGDASCSAYSAAGVGAYSHTYTYDAVGNLTSYAGSSYTYGAVNDKPHAVRSAFGNSYAYDGNGNQVSRTIAGVSYSFVYDAANRLVEVKQGELAIATFLYDAAGNRVKGTVAGVTTVYIAGLYEQSGAGSTSYYEGGAMRRTGYPDSNGVYYLLQDRLKSTSVIVSEGGAEAAREYYYPFGGNRGDAAFSDLTTKRFTGQYHEQGLPGAEGLSYYNARWYDPQLGRFTSPDTLVPKPQNPQDFNRYSYARNNPTNSIDPSGHYDVKPGDDPWWKYARPQRTVRKGTVAPRIFYLNGLGGDPYMQPKSSPYAEYEHLYYRLQQYAGAANVVHVPLFTNEYDWWGAHRELVQEAVAPSKPWTDTAVRMIADDLEKHPLQKGQKIVIVGSSAGGTVAIEALPRLATHGIHVNQVILRGSPVWQPWLYNVDTVDYLAADPPTSDHYYSVDINPFDEVNVSQHIVTGLYGHVPESTAENDRVWTLVGYMIVDLIDDMNSRK